MEKKDIQLGMLVEVIPFNTTGTVISLPNKSNEVQIQIGNTKMNISLSNLNKTNKTLTNENFSTTKVNRNNGSKSKYISPEINVIGQNVDEAIYIIDKYLDVFEEGLNNGFSEFNINCPDDYNEAAIDELNKIFENTPYSLYENVGGLCFRSNAQKNYFNYLMYLKDKYESEDDNNNLDFNSSPIKVLKPQHHSDR